MTTPNEHPYPQRQVSEELASYHARIDVWNDWMRGQIAEAEAAHPNVTINRLSDAGKPIEYHGPSGNYTGISVGQAFYLAARDFPALFSLPGVASKTDAHEQATQLRQAISGGEWPTDSDLHMLHGQLQVEKVADWEVMRDMLREVVQHRQDIRSAVEQ